MKAGYEKPALHQSLDRTFLFEFLYPASGDPFASLDWRILYEGVLSTGPTLPDHFHLKFDGAADRRWGSE